ncbi:MAG: serine hydrolase domain-containing protein [Acidobacteriota bacterium]
MAVSLNGELVDSAGFGLAQIEHGVPIKGTSVFHAASVSKQFTAYSVFLLEAAGKLSLDHEVADYFPELESLGAITVRHLLTHTSGLRDQWTLLGMAGWHADDLRTDDQIRRLIFRQKGLNFPPGSRYEYNNSNYFLLAQLVEEISGQTFREFTRQHVFEPLGMSRTQFYDDHSRPVANRAYSYLRLADGFAKGNLNFATVGPTGLMTTAEDLLLWAENLRSGEQVASSVRERLAERATAGDGRDAVFAMGQEERESHGFVTWSHGGRDAGYRAFLLRVPAAGFAVALLGNRSDLDTAKIAFQILEAFLADHPSYTAPAPLRWSPASRADLAAFSGTYELIPGLIFSLSTDGEKLFFAPHGVGQGTALPQVGKDEFALNPEVDLTLRFPDPGDGPVSHFEYQIGLHGSLLARRVELVPFDAANLDLAQYEGRYFSDELQTEYELRVAGGVLIVDHFRLGPVSLRPYQQDLFSSSDSGLRKIEFERDSEGRIVGWRGSGILAEGVWFVRRTPSARGAIEVDP